jgi:copper(I)-binding protein
VDAPVGDPYIARMTRPASVLLAAALVLAGGVSVAEDYSIGTIQVGSPWTRATPKGSTVAGAYMTITNKGAAPDRLLGGSSAVADRFEVHSMVMDAGVAKMRPVDGGLEVKPGETLELKPGGFHVMLTGLKQPLEKGQKVKATLEFEKAGKVDVEYVVEAPGAPAPAMHQH